MSALGQVLILVLFGLVVRWAISLNSYSGAGTPPMYGDYEAQRHWMEITYNLPISMWYENGTDNDLSYWGLDYPPLTAYHSWLCGAIANKINSSWVELYQSRGMESFTHKLFMRYSVVIVDLLVYFPAVYAYAYTDKSTSDKNKLLSMVSLLFFPGLLLIDHGHFQYNCVSLGFALWGIVGIASGHDLLGSAAFVLALNYKQMELYHAIPFFCYLLGSCFNGKQNWLLKLLKLGLVVLGTFALCWLPFLQNRQGLLQVLHRLFPFNRGLYEDKVANIWCSLSLLVKLKELLPIQSLIKVCLASTLLTLVPSALNLLLKPSVARFQISLVNASLVFFLFSFQVHEKSILLVALPVCLLLPHHPLPCLWFLLTATFSMLPLLIKDGLVLAYFASSLLFYFLLRELQDSADTDNQTKVVVTVKNKIKTLINVLFVASMLGSVTLTVASLTLQPPKRYPDLFPVLISIYSCGHFVLFLLYFHWLQFTVKDTISVTTVKSPVKSPVKSVRESKLSRKKKQ